MAKFWVLTSCYFVLAAAQTRIETTLLSFHGEPKPGHVEAFRDDQVKKVFANLLGKSLPLPRHEEPDNSESAPSPVPEVMLIHRQLQNKLGWASDDGGNSNNNQQKNQYGPPPQNNIRNQYGPPPGNNLKNQYGPPPGNNLKNQYGPPPNGQQQYGPPPPANNVRDQYGPPPNGQQQYGPPPPANNVRDQYGPPPNGQQQYGPPPPANNVRDQYGPPPPPPNVQQQYGPPAKNVQQQYGPPPPGNNLKNQYGPPPNVQNQYGAPPPNVREQYGPPPPPNNVREQYGPPPPNVQQHYGPPANNVREQYGPPPPPENGVKNQYGPPGGFPQSNNHVKQNEEYGVPPPPNSNQGYATLTSVNQGNIGGFVENFKSSDAHKQGGYAQGSLSNNLGLNDIGGQASSGSKIYKHVYIHTPPPEQDAPEQPRVIRPNHKQETHYNIIFVKTPTQKEVPVEVEIPAPPERKTLVYVLVKKPEKPAEIKFRAPPPTQPSKPEVYFIRYKHNLHSNGNGAPADFSDLGSNSIDASGPSEGYSSPPAQLLIDATRNVESGGGHSLKANAGYPNTEYRAPPSMLNPNQEPMSIAVYDRVRNGVAGSSSSSAGAAATSSRGQQGSHYTAPGSQPFDRASGKMINGQYLGMTSLTSTSANNQYYSPPAAEEDQGGY